MYPNRTMCDVLEEMRKAYETRNFAGLLGMIEEVQGMGNRMEAGLQDKHDMKNYREKALEAEKERDELKKEIKDLEKVRDQLKEQNENDEKNSAFIA